MTNWQEIRAFLFVLLNRKWVGNHNWLPAADTSLLYFRKLHIHFGAASYVTLNDAPDP